MLKWIVRILRLVQTPTRETTWRTRRWYSNWTYRRAAQVEKKLWKPSPAPGRPHLRRTQIDKGMYEPGGSEYCAPIHQHADGLGNTANKCLSYTYLTTVALRQRKEINRSLTEHGVRGQTASSPLNAPGRRTEAEDDQAGHDTIHSFH